MKKIVSTLIILFFLVLTSLIIILSTIGIETNRFNKVISKKINQINNNINLKLTTIKFKLDIKEIGLFVETNNSRIDYRETIIPAKNIKVYINFTSLITSKPKIKKIDLILDQIDIEQLKKISINFKPSNFTSYVNNKIDKGKLNTGLELYLDNNNQIDNFIARGSVLNLKAQIINGINLDKTNFSFFADKDDILLKNISSEMGPIKIDEGDLKLKLNPEITVETNFKTNLKYNNKSINYFNLIKDYNFAKNIINLKAELNNSFFINFDKTYKVKNYDYKSNGKIIKADLKFKKPQEFFFLNENISKLSFTNLDFKTSFIPQKNTTNILGKYSINNDNFLSFKLENIMDKELLKLKLEADYKKPFDLEIINYKKSKDTISNISINLEKKKDNIRVKKLNLTEKNNLIAIEDIRFNKEKFLSFKKMSVKT